MPDRPDHSLTPRNWEEVFDGRYELRDELGEGGMCTVFLGVDLKEARPVALKVLDRSLADRADIRRRFDAEARAMMSISHRHVLSIYDVGEFEGLPYMSMQFCSAGTLSDWVTNNGPMPPRMAAGAVTQICKGVGAAHAKGIIHRDIKPQNILLTGRGICKVADFGIARVEMSNMTQTHHAMGTLGFMAPEQRNAARNVDARADVYALGATLYYLLTGQVVMDLFVAHEDTSLLEGVHPELVPVLLKATKYRPGERYGSGAEMARALHEVRQRLPRPPPETPQLAETGVKHAFGGIEEYDLETEETPISTGTPVSLEARNPSLRPTANLVPDYVDPKSLSGNPDRGFEIAVDETSRQKAQQARARSLADGVLVEEEERPEVRVSAMAIGGGAVLVAVVVCMIAVVVFSWMRVSDTDAAAIAARADWYGAIEANATLADDLSRLGAHGNELKLALEDYKIAKGEPERGDAAVVYHDKALQSAARLVRGNSQTEREVQAVVEVLKERRAAYEAAMPATQSVRQDLVVRLLMGAGVAPPVVPDRMTVR